MVPFSSYGYFTTEHKVFMRLTSLLTDLLLYIPSAFLLSKELVPRKHCNLHLAFFFLIAMMPSLVVIDHGHFQFNSAMMGLSLLSVYFLLKKQLVMCCVSLTLGVNFKVTTLFYSLAIAVAVLARALHHRLWPYLLIKLMVVVSFVFFVVWYPVVN